MESINLQYFSPTERVPLIGNFELTRKCPFRCVICYNDLEKREEMSYEEILSYIDELSQMGCLYLNFTGGDPLVREEFADIYTYAVKKGIKPSVETNGLLLNDNHIKLFRRYPPDKLQISVYATHDAVLQRTVGSNCSARDILKKVDQLKRERIPFYMRTPLSILNLEDAHHIFNLGKELNIPHTFNLKIFWRQSGERCFQYRCSTDAIRPFLGTHPVYEELYKTAEYLEKSIIKRGDCFTGIYDFNLNAYGKLNFCIVFWKPVYDLRKGSFADAWNNWYCNYRRMEDNYCIGKYLFDGHKNCPWGYLYHETAEDCSIGLDERVRMKWKGYEKSGKSREVFCKDLSLDSRSFEYFVPTGE